MEKKGIWHAITLSNYSFANDEGKNITMNFKNLGTSTIKMDSIDLNLPIMNSSLDRKLITSQNIPYSIILYDYWLGTGKANIDNRIYEFKRDNITSSLCINDDQDIVISFEEVDPFSTKYSATFYNFIDEKKSLLLCIGFFFYLKLKNNIF